MPEEKTTWTEKWLRRLPGWARTPESLRLARYAVIGGLTTAVNFGLFALLHGPLGWDENLSNVVAVVCAIVFAYLANKRFVFRTHCADMRELLREAFAFFTARAATLALEIFGLPILLATTDLSEYWIKLGLTVLVILLNYVFSKLFVFRPGREVQPKDDRSV